MDQILLESFPTHGRLTLRIDDGIPVEWKTSATGFQALLRGVSFTDLGAPLGSEAQWAAEVSRRLERGQRDFDGKVASVELHEVAEGVMIQGTWRYPSGPNAPAHPEMQSFGYRERNPGRYIVDFWPKPGPTVAEAEAERRQRLQAAARRRSRDELNHRISRRIASEREIAAAYRVDAFCSQPLSDEHDVFPSFKPVHEPLDYSRYLPMTTPDSQFTYPRPDGDGRDARYVRLALDLYQKGRNALVIRTLDFLNAECPKSSYGTEMLFLRANAMIKLNPDLADEADRLLERLKNDAKGSPEALRAGMYLAGKLASGNRPLAASEAFLWLERSYPGDRLAWFFHLGAAEALYSIQQMDGAAREYEWVVKNGPNDEIKVDAATRLGDLNLARRQYELALAAYSNAARVFQVEASSLPPLYLNRGEALYQLGQYGEARKVFEEYLRKFPSYPGGWRATFRMGEILGRLEGAENQAASRRYFYATINQYPFSAGSTLARLRLLPCGDHGGYDAEAADRFFETEAKAFDMPRQLFMVHYRDMYNLARLRTLVGMKRYGVAVDVAAREISETRVEHVKRTLQHLFSTLFRRHIMDLLDKGERYEALNFYNHHLDYVGYDIGAGEPGYLLRLSSAASDLGLGKLAEAIVTQYRKATSDGAGPTPGRTLASGEATPAPPLTLDQRLRASEKDFADAKALWVGAGLSDAGAGLSGAGGGKSDAGAATRARIRELLARVVPESPSSWEKELILGLLEERSGHLPLALAHALQAQLLLPEDASAPDALRIEAWLASLEARGGNPSTALRMYRNLEKDLEFKTAKATDRKMSKPTGKTARKAADPSREKDGGSGEAALLGVPEAPDLGTILLAEGAILESRRRWSESASLYAKAMKQGFGGNQMAYSYARALLRTGRAGVRDKAVAALEGVAASKEDDFWKKMAVETLEDLKVRRRE